MQRMEDKSLCITLHAMDHAIAFDVETPKRKPVISTTKHNPNLQENLG